MSYEHSHRCSYSGILNDVSVKQLIRFLTPYAGYLKSRGFEMPQPGVETSHDYRALQCILQIPNEDTPNDLTNALHYIEDMATPHALERLLDEVEAQNFAIDDSECFSLMDVAIQVWMLDKRVIERIHAEQFLVKPCTFLYYQAERQSCAEAMLSPDSIGALERELDERFQRRKVGRDCRVYHYPRQDGIWFMVWHGAPFSPKNCVDSQMPACICCSPERHDVLIYQPATRELQIDAETNGEREIYRELFGRHLFGNDHHFPGTAIYTLDPLMRDGSRSLVCSDVPGMESVTLKEIEVCWGAPIKTVITVETSDALFALNRGKVAMPQEARIVEARFLIKFSDRAAPRMVWVRPSNVIRLERDSDWTVVENWLRLRGFILIK